ncbi:MAG TPA: RimK family alpha-L-glutamate ligase [Burkholderiales bacterium]|nr:RimK family alpha-L-glutamate ligase [Burkholderiales bacterium]
MVRRVAIITDDPGWHGRQLRRAFAARGWDSLYISLQDCYFDLARARNSLVIPGFKNCLPDAVFVRGVAGGTLEQVILRLDILHALRELGVPVYNDARAIERSVDKAMTSFLLKRAGIPTPATWVCESSAQARAILLRETAAGRELVMKPLFGSQGLGLLHLKSGMKMPDLSKYAGTAYLQSFINCAKGDWHDFRVLVVGGSARAAMLRRGTTWISNVAQGAKCEKMQLDENMQRLAQDASRVLGMDYAGVDVMRDLHGELYVIEVNGIPAWKGLQGVCRENLAQLLVDDLLARKLTQVGMEMVC